MKTNYSKDEFNSSETSFGIMPILRKKADVKNQTDIDIDDITAIKLLRIENMCSIRKIQDRIKCLENAGLYVTQNPMKTGYGVGTCYKKMNAGFLRIRVSANWRGKFGNYSLCVHI